jgi:hypothetical protein
MVWRLLPLGAALLFVAPLWCEDPAHPDLKMDGKVVGRYAKPKPGEYCSLCYERLQAEDLVYVVWGQRVGVHSGSEDEDFRANPKKWIAHLRPGGAFLGVEGALDSPQQALSGLWFAAGLYVLLGLIFGALCAHRAFHTGYPPGTWFAMGLALNVVAYIALGFKPKREVSAVAGVPHGLRKFASTLEPVPCPACGGTNHPSASKCLECGATLEPQTLSEVEKAS